MKTNDAVEAAYAKFQKLATENGWVYNKNQERSAFEAGYQAAEHAGEWVPVSERLPDKHGTYPVTVDNGHGRWVEHITFNVNDPQRAMRQWMTLYNQEWITAWREMPAPYNPKEDE